MRALEIEFLCEFESIFEAALAYESGYQLGTFGEITLDKKISRYCPFNHILGSFLPDSLADELKFSLWRICLHFLLSSNF